MKVFDYMVVCHCSNSGQKVGELQIKFKECDELWNILENVHDG